MTTRDWTELISAYLDDELSPAERREFEDRLARGEISARELEEMRAMRNLTTAARPQEFPDETWDRYWDQTYNRLERGFGWILFSIGAIVLLSFGVYRFLLSLFAADGAWWIRLATGLVAAGLSLLFVSVLRERLFVWKHDPYREVKR
ncbi:MAG: zf-HC2 domain-containing protein [Candidatus Eisenbacteria bacterium]